MQALTTASAGRGVDPMAHRPQFVGDVLPYPTAMPGATNTKVRLIGRRAVVLRVVSCVNPRAARLAPPRNRSSLHRHGTYAWMAHIVGVSTLPEIIKQLANNHLRLIPMRFASGRVNA